MKREHSNRYILGTLLVAAVCLCPLVLAQGKGKRKGLGNEIEGAIWEFTATRKVKDKEEKITGKFRIDNGRKGLFDAHPKRVKAERENRIGDIIKDKDKDEIQLVFSDFDLLDGRAHIKKEDEQKNDLWVGYFLDKDKDRWRFEIRKIDD